MKPFRKVIPVFLTTAMVATLMFATAMPVNAHYPGAVIQSKWATTMPTIDGVFGPDEWSDAAIVDLQAADPNNELEAYAYLKNNAALLYICIDVPDDTTADFNDASTISFDTGHDGNYTDGHDDTFMIEAGTTWHGVSDGTPDNIICCSPFDPTLPLHSGLAGDWGLGSSPNSGEAHRIYEYSIPLALLLASPGDTIGFAMDGTMWMGIYDDSTEHGSQWPFLRWDPIFINEYGDLILATGVLPAEFSATPTTGPTPLEVQFTDDSGCDFTSWNWDFGDGGTSSEQNPMHTYAHPGPYTVSLTASGGPCQNGTTIKIDYIHPYTMGVGGEAYPVNKVGLLAPWLGLALFLAGGGVLVMRRRRAN